MVKKLMADKIHIKTLPSGISKAISKCPLIIGIGPSAWPRIISAFYFPKFKILCYSDCQDNKFIRDLGVEVFCLREEYPNLEVAPVNPGKIIDTPLAKEYFSKQSKPFVFLVYKSIGNFEKVCEENGWKFLGNKKAIRDKYEDKRIFKETLREIGIEAIPGENIPIEMLTKERFAYYQEKFGQEKLVLQIAEATWGGGSGTLFMDKADNLNLFFERVSELRKDLEGKKKKLETVNIAPFIEGESVSIPCCATKYGVLTGSVQTQIMDIPEVGAVAKKRSGIFAGHDWAYKHFGDSVQEQASKIGQRFGDYLYKNEFKGIFGLDLIVDKNNKVWPVECNPRETDAFPLICMLQMEKGAIPMQVFHNLEHLGISYDFDFEEVDKSYKKEFNAGQILLYNKLDKYVVDRGVIKAGIYKVEDGKLKYLREGCLFSNLEAEEEFLITEDVYKRLGNTYLPKERVLRIIKKGGILKEKGIVKQEIAEIAKLIYRELKLTPVEFGLVKEHGLNILFYDRFLEVKKSKELKDADIVNVIAKTKEGFRRPLQIAWRKKLSNKDLIIDQIQSKRARKQLKSDIKKIPQLGIEIQVLPEINQEIFDSWLTLYKRIISEKEKGDVLVSKDWLNKKKEKGKKVGAILAYKEGNLIAGGLFFEVSGILCEGYGISEKISGLSGGLSQLLDYYFLDYAKDNNYQEVSFGQDTNFYGYDLSKGLINYKAKFGFTPVPARKTYFINTFFLNFEKLEDDILFFTQEESGMILNVITGNKDFDKSRVYPPQGIKEIRVFNKDDIVRKDRRTLMQ